VSLRKPFHPEKEMALFISLYRQTTMFSSIDKDFILAALICTFKPEIEFCKKSSDLFKSPIQHKPDNKVKKESNLKIINP